MCTVPPSYFFHSFIAFFSSENFLFNKKRGWKTTNQHLSKSLYSSAFEALVIWEFFIFPQIFQPIIAIRERYYFDLGVVQKNSSLKYSYKNQYRFGIIWMIYFEISRRESSFWAKKEYLDENIEKYEIILLEGFKN